MMNVKEYADAEIARINRIQSKSNGRSGWQVQLGPKWLELILL